MLVLAVIVVTKTGGKHFKQKGSAAAATAGDVNAFHSGHCKGFIRAMAVRLEAALFQLTFSIVSGILKSSFRR